MVRTAEGELGHGEPYYRYTVGQRRGLGVAAGERRYVLEVLPAENAVVVGDEADLMAPGLAGERLHWIGPPPSGPVEATVKIRSRHPGVAALIRPQAKARSAASRSTSPSRSAASRPARRRSSIAARECSAAAGSPAGSSGRQSSTEAERTGR